MVARALLRVAVSRTATTTEQQAVVILHAMVVDVGTNMPLHGLVHLTRDQTHAGAVVADVVDVADVTNVVDEADGTRADAAGIRDETNQNY